MWDPKEANKWHVEPIDDYMRSVCKADKGIALSCGNENEICVSNCCPAANCIIPSLIRCYFSRFQMLYQQACYLKFMLRDFTSCLCSAASWAVCFEGSVAGVKATQTGNEVSQPALEFTSLFINLVIRPSYSRHLDCPQGYVHTRHFPFDSIPGHGTISSHAVIKTAEDCSALCDYDDRCCSFDYSDNSNICNLYKGCETWQRSSYRDNLFCSKESEGELNCGLSYIYRSSGFCPRI